MVLEQELLQEVTLQLYLQDILVKQLLYLLKRRSIGSGFTGVILSVNNAFVRLLTRIGPPPGCSLGNTCNDFNVNP